VVHGDIHLSVALSRANSSLDELCELLETRAQKINEELKHFEDASVAEFLEKFNTLHQKHLSALRDDKAILAHDILTQKPYAFASGEINIL
jgi:hypothetical protein